MIDGLHLRQSRTLITMQDKDEKPVCVVLPADATRVEVNETAEAALAALFAITALATTLNVNAARYANSKHGVDS